MKVEDEKAALQEKIEECKPLISEIYQVFMDRMAHHGLLSLLTQESLPHLDLTSWTVTKDPFDQTENLIARWINTSNKKKGELIIRENSSLYSEIDILLVDPNNPKILIESIVIWGKRKSLKSELKRLEYSEPF